MEHIFNLQNSYLVTHYHRPVLNWYPPVWREQWVQLSRINCFPIWVNAWQREAASILLWPHIEKYSLIFFCLLHATASNTKIKYYRASLRSMTSSLSLNVKSMTHHWLALSHHVEADTLVHIMTEYTYTFSIRGAFLLKRRDSKTKGRESHKLLIKMNWQ